MRRAMVTALLMLAAALLLLTLTLLAGVQLLVALARPRTADVLALLADLPALLRAAEADDARAVLQELFEQITLAPHQALTARPRPAYKNLLIAIDQQVAVTGQWAGWAPSTRPLQLNEFLVV